MVQTLVSVQGLSDSIASQSGSVVQAYKLTVPFTQIINRAQMIDVSRDLLPRMGINRIMTQKVVEVQGEYGANNDRVWKPINDTSDQIRFVGSWASNVDTNGTKTINSGPGSGDYIEITFYGTGLNVMLLADNNGRNFTVGVDGGSQGSNIVPSTASLVDTRGYSTNQSINAVSGLTLGTHTVKLVASTGSLPVYGFEILNTAGTSPNTLQLVPGVSYTGGKKNTVASLVADSYNSNFESGTLGTVGGHVLVYQKSDGTIKKAVTPTGTPLYLTSANHVNESVIRSFGPREFGAGRSDDFSTLGATSQTSAFTLDDGTTTLVATSCGFNSAASTDCLYTNNTNAFATFTFVGTGLDILAVSNSSNNVDATTVLVDGTSVGTITTTPFSGALGIIKVASGLPYGTHTVKFLRTANSVSSIQYARFIVYGPSLPALPTGANQLADYYVMANYVANATSGAGFIGTGVMRKSNTRELIAVGSSWTYTLDSTELTGWQLSTGNNTDYIEYVFYGVGFEFRSYNSPVSITSTITIDGATNMTVSNSSPTTGAGWTGALTISAYGTGATFTASTGTFTQTSGGNAPGAGVSINGLTLGLHRVRFTRVSGTNGLSVEAFDVITPIHSPKSNVPGDIENTLGVGSQAIGDGRNFGTSQVKSLANWAQAVGVNTNPTTTSATFVPLVDMICQIKTSGNPIEVFYSVENDNPGLGVINEFQVYVDGVAIGFYRGYQASTSSQYQNSTSDSIIVPVAAGVHVVQLFWSSAGGGTARANGNSRTLKVREIS